MDARQERKERYAQDDLKALNDRLAEIPRDIARCENDIGRLEEERLEVELELKERGIEDDIENRLVGADTGFGWRVAEEVNFVTEQALVPEGWMRYASIKVFPNQRALQAAVNQTPVTPTIKPEFDPSDEKKADRGVTASLSKNP